MAVLTEDLQAAADQLRKQAEPIWETLKTREDHERDRRAFESSLEHLEQQRICITVMGEFNTGKSTLLNAFIGDELLATDQLECTAVTTWVRRTEDETINENRQTKVIYTNGESEFIARSEISLYTTLDQDSWEKIERVEIALPAEKGQPTGLVLVDTPGLNGNPELETRSIHQLGMSHVAIVVVPVTGVERRSDINLIKKARGIADRVMVVINKCDQHAKKGDGFDRYKEELRRLVPDLPYKDIYALSAKRVFDGNAYQAGEEELKGEFYRFRDDLSKHALADPSATLKKRPLWLLRGICKKEIAHIKKLESECDTSVSKELEAAEAQLKEEKADLERSQENILQLARETLMEEVGILEQFLNREQSSAEREMRRFIDGLEDELRGGDDLDKARKMVSKRLNEIVQKPIFDRVSRLLNASADRLIDDLESRVRISKLNLPAVASIKASLKQQADKAVAALSHREDEIEQLKKVVANCRRALRKQEEKANQLEKLSAPLEGLKKQRKEAKEAREGLGPRPAPKVIDYTVEVEVDRTFWDWLRRKPKTVLEQRQRKDYTLVEKWERDFEAADKKVADLDKKIAPLKQKWAEKEKAEGKIPKLQREAEKALANKLREEARLKEERERYRNEGIQTRKSQLNAGVRRELDRIFESLPRSIEREAEQMLENISGGFSTRFSKAAKRQQKLLVDEMERKKTEAREADAERVQREGVRKRLVDALETFLNEDQGARK